MHFLERRGHLAIVACLQALAKRLVVRRSRDVMQLWCGEQAKIVHAGVRNRLDTVDRRLRQSWRRLTRVTRNNDPGRDTEVNLKLSNKRLDAVNLLVVAGVGQSCGMGFPGAFQHASQRIYHFDSVIGGLCEAVIITPTVLPPKYFERKAARIPTVKLT